MSIFKRFYMENIYIGPFWWISDSLNYLIMDEKSLQKISTKQCKEGITQSTVIASFNEST